MITLTADVRRRTAVASHALAVLLSLAIFCLAGCHRTPAAEDAKEGAPERSGEGVALTAEQVRKLGVTTEPAKATDYAAQIIGYGVVIPHDAVAAAVAELTTAQAAQAQSRSAAARAQRLAGTPGAMSADAVESATRQVASDTAAVDLARQRLSSVVGAGLPGISAAGMQDLASGKVKLLRATFPLGTLQGAAPTALRAAHLDSTLSGSAPNSRGWSLHPVWNAPADASLPGRSFFALLKDSDAGEGERLLVWTPGTAAAQHGVLVPAAALVISSGKYWCYVQQKDGLYVRREVATDKPLGDGYVITQGIAVGDKLVTAGSSLLLAREMNPSTEAD